MTAVVDRLTSVRHLVFAMVGMLVLAGCQLDVVVDVVVEDDGTGTITVVAQADAELVERVPTIAEELVLDDVVAAGWTVDGPNETSDGGLTLTLSHDFEDENEATNLLKSLGSPFNNPVVGRGQDGDTANNTVRSNLGLPTGYSEFADDELVSAVGGIPFADEFEAGGFTPANSFSAVLRVQLPGEIIDGETNGDVDGNVIQWTVPLEPGEIQEASARSTQAPSEGAVWARPVSTLALILLIAWLSFMTLFIGYVALARWRRARRYRRRGLPLAERRQL